MANRQTQAYLTRLNKSHPLARGMTVALMPSHGGAISSLVNLADPTNPFVVGNSTVAVGSGFYGQHIAKTANGFNQTHVATRSADAYTANSGIILLNSLLGTGSNAVNAGLCGFQATGAGVYTDPTAKLKLRMGSTEVATGGTTMGIGPSVVGWSSYTGDYHVFLNGAEDTASSSSTTFGVQGVIDRVGCFNGGSVQGQFAFALILQWNRFITADEHDQLAREPFQMFTTLRRPVRWTLPAAGNNTLTAPLGTLTVAGLVPTITQGNSITGLLGTLTLSGLTPTLTQGHSATAPLGTLTLSGLVPTVAQPVALTAPLGTLNLSGLTPTITQGNSAVAPLGTLNLTGLVATFTQGNAAQAPLGTLTLGGLTPTILQTGGMQAPLGTLSLAGLTPAITQGNSASAPLGVLTLAGLTHTFTQGNAAQAPLGTLTLGGLTPTFQQAGGMLAPLGTLALTGLTPTVGQGNAITAPLGSLNLVGLAPSISQGNAASAPLGTLLLAGLTPTVVQTGPVSVTAPLGAITMVGLDVTIAQSAGGSGGLDWLAQIARAKQIAALLADSGPVAMQAPLGILVLPEAEPVLTEARVVDLGPLLNVRPGSVMDVDAELEEFRAFMQLLAEAED